VIDQLAETYAKNAEMMRAGRCQTCKWWGGQSNPEADMVWPCRKAETDEYGALAVGDCGDHGIFTLPGFGCVHWEAK
jgi:hypothetical protein